jgi:hypothetical protein
VKSKVLIGVIGAVFVVCAGVFAFAAWKIMKRPRAGGGLAGRVSRDAIVIGSLDLRQVRAWQPALDARDALTRPPQSAAAMQREAAEKYAEFVRNCGIDPWQKLDTVSIAVERSAVAGTDNSAVVGFADGTFTQVDADRCIRWIATQSNRTIAPTTVSGHTVLTPVRQGQQPEGREAQYTLLGNSVMATEPRYTQRALAVLDGSSPSLAADAPLNQMMRRLGPTVFLGGAADVAELRARQARTADEVIDNLVRQNPTAPDLALLRQARMGGFGLAVVANNLSVAVRVEVPTAANAQSLTGACTTVVNARRTEALQALRQAKQAQAMMRLTVGAVAGMAERFAALDRGFDAGEQVLNQLACRTEGSDAVLAVTVTQPQITSLQSAIRAFSEVMAEASRLNPLGGMFGGGRQGGPSLGGPGGIELPVPPAL